MLFLVPFQMCSITARRDRCKSRSPANQAVRHTSVASRVSREIKFSHHWTPGLHQAFYVSYNVVVSVNVERGKTIRNTHDKPTNILLPQTVQVEHPRMITGRTRGYEVDPEHCHDHRTLYSGKPSEFGSSSIEYWQDYGGSLWLHYLDRCTMSSGVGWSQRSLISGTSQSSEEGDCHHSQPIISSWAMGINTHIVASSTTTRYRIEFTKNNWLSRRYIPQEWVWRRTSVKSS